MSSTRVERLVLIALAAVYCAWAAVFIYQSSYVALDGQRYFALFDDAMISMRYAWNFAHGHGLVWNVGERVEGYSNLLMTLLMSLPSVFLGKRYAVLAVQILGIPTMLAAAVFARSLAHHVSEDGPRQGLIGALAFAAVLLYFPLSYWTLMGMETGLLTLLILVSAWAGLRWLERKRNRDLVIVGVAAGLAFLTRNDSLVLSALIFAYLAWQAWSRTHEPRPLLPIAWAILILAAFVIGQTLFRYLYYGDLLPNTYALKLTRYPLKIRLIDGTRYVVEFLAQTWFVFLLGILAVIRIVRPARWLLVALIAGVVAYQVYVGGDPWVTWRMLSPAMPFALILAAVGSVELVLALGRIAGSRYASAAMALIFAAALLVADLPFLSDMSVRGPTSAAIANRTNTNSALAVMTLTDPAATIGVIWAGTLPYYVDRYAIDYLGKSDPYIASLAADVSGSSGWRNQITIPGHNKYDLDYSIVQRQPTYSQAFSWGYATVRPFFVENYVRVEYHGRTGTKTVFLLKDSPLVCWEACQDQYRIIPWPK